MLELDEIRRYYGIQRAKRSGVLYIKHIVEGLIVLDEIKATEWAKRAFCAHPLVQNDEELRVNCTEMHRFHPNVIMLAMEYRWVANSYLSHHPSKPAHEIYLSSLPDVNDMLIADKVQNYKDFLIYQVKTHPRLDQYFRQWLLRLCI